MHDDASFTTVRQYRSEAACVRVCVGVRLRCAGQSTGSGPVASFSMDAAAEASAAAGSHARGRLDAPLRAGA